MNAEPLAALPMSLIADVAARLTKSDNIVANVQDVLATLQATLAADECSIWLHGPDGLVLATRAGKESAGVTTINNALDRGSKSAVDGVVVRRLSYAGRRLGALVTVLTSPLTQDVDMVFDSLAALLGSTLAHAEQVRQLKTELDVRARQIDDQRKLTERIIDALPVGLYVIDREFRVQVWNRNRETGLQGVSRERALGRTIFEILHRQPAEALRKEFDEVFRSGRIKQFNIESKGSGEPRTYRITKVPMRLTEGEVSHVISIGEDVTDWTTAQNRFAQSEKLAAIGQLAAGVMHEVNNPLATIAVCAESLGLRLDGLREKGVDVPPQTGEFLSIIDGEVHRCKGIVDRLLAFSRPQVTKLEPVDLNHAIEQTLFLVKHHDRFKKINVKTLFDETLPQVQGNGEQLIQVFMALLINAADAMAETGNITVRTRRGSQPNEGVVAEVIDEGPGIPRADLPKIFEPFYTTKPAGRGTGLGLSICYGIVTEHGGRIEVDSAVGAGSTFRVLLPLPSEAL